MKKNHNVYENKQSVDFPIIASPTRTLTDGNNLKYNLRFVLKTVNLSVYTSS